MIESHATSTESRQIRVFLSSTFVDFMEERELLVKRVFPALNRRARDRGVELIDVDLRWGVTEEQTKQGLTLPLCLGEIDRCRPYFIGLLGERHGWVPPADFYKPELLERQPWLRQHQGGASVTELEILHGVLRNPEMAGHAFFYLRDPAYALAKKDPTWLAEGEEERQRLQALKEQVRASRFPVVEGLPDPEAIASRIEDDLWELIEERFPEQEQPDALEQENRKHASYRHSRTSKGQYIGGEGYIEQLEGWIQDDEQQILITGPSGSGKSALLANWMVAHAKAHPEDVVYSHHLGCTNDASAVRPLLGRLIENASRLLHAEGLINEELVIPQDWWDLVAKVAETLQNVSRWCKKTGRRWLWVLDGLDRLNPEDQNALPWLPQNLPAGVFVMASALACQAREILINRGYSTLTIKLLAVAEQEQLIKRYLQRYTKELDGGLRQQILSHPLAGSPLFLKVLLEELRQCGRHDTLKGQLEFYLSSQTIDNLYERVLERLENDGSGDAIRKLMKAIWASRAGLTETELLEMTDLALLQWAPIDLALEKAFGRNGARLVFDHDFLRIAVEDRYLKTQEARRQAHSELADWFGAQTKWDERKAEELPWQLHNGGRISDLRILLLRVGDLYELARKRDNREVINFWQIAKGEGDGELDELIAKMVEEEIEKRKDDSEDLIRFADRIAALLDEAGLYRELLLRLRTLSLELEENSDDRDQVRVLVSLSLLASAYRDTGKYQQAKSLYERCLCEREALLGPEHSSTMATASNLAGVYVKEGNYKMAESLYRRILYSRERLLGKKHPKTLMALSNIGHIFDLKDELDKAESIYEQVLDARKEMLGGSHRATLTSMIKIASIYRQQDGRHKKAERLYIHVLAAREAMLGPDHPSTIAAVEGLGILYEETGEYAASEQFYERVLNYRQRVLGAQHPLVFTALLNLADINEKMRDLLHAELLLSQGLEGREKILGIDHHQTHAARYRLADFLSRQKRFSESIILRRRELAWCRKHNGDTDPGTLISIHGLAADLRKNGELQESEQLYLEALSGRIASLDNDDDDTMANRYGLARCLSDQGRYAEAIELRRLELAWCRQQKGDTDPGTLTSINGLAIDLREIGELEEAETLFLELVTASQQVLEPEAFQIGRALGGMAKTLEEAGKLEEAAAYRLKALDHRLEHKGPDAWWTNRNRLDLARVLGKLGRDSEALAQLQELQQSMGRNDNSNVDDRELIIEAAELLRFTYGVQTPEA